MRSKTKVMLLAFFDSEGIINHKYAPDGQTVNKEFYMEVLRRLHESVRRKRLEKWQDGNWILHHDNAPAHTSHLVHQFLAKHSTAQLQQPPYSPDLAPCDLFLFPRLNPSVWIDEHCSSWGKHHLSWNDEHHSSCARFHSFVYISTT